MKCPGQDTRYWKPGDIFEIECPNCGNRVEFFKDEATRRCRGCKQMVLNPRIDFGCAAYCKYAAECLGQMGPELAARRDDLLKDRVAIEVKRRLGQDFRRIAHGVKVARFAEQIGREEKAALAVVLCAAYLHLFYEGSVGDKQTAEDYGEQNMREVLEKVGAKTDLTQRVMDLTRAFLTEARDSSVEAMVLSDAHLLAGLAESGEQGVVQGNMADLKGRLLTGTGRMLASALAVNVAESDEI
jgi:hypothetical protein